MVLDGSCVVTFLGKQDKIAYFHHKSIPYISNYTIPPTFSTDYQTFSINFGKFIINFRDSISNFFRTDFFIFNSSFLHSTLERYSRLSTFITNSHTPPSIQRTANRHPSPKQKKPRPLQAPEPSPSNYSIYVTLATYPSSTSSAFSTQLLESSFFNWISSSTLRCSLSIPLSKSVNGLANFMRRRLRRPL